MQPQKQIRIEDICNLLEIPVSYYGLNERMPKEQAEKALQDFKDLVKKQHRVLAKKYHPDKTGGDDEKIKEINAIIDLIMKLKITKVQRREPKMTFHFYGGQGTGRANWSNDSTTSNGGFGSFGGFKFYNR